MMMCKYEAFMKAFRVNEGMLARNGGQLADAFVGEGGGMGFMQHAACRIPHATGHWPQDKGRRRVYYKYSKGWMELRLLVSRVRLPAVPSGRSRRSCSSRRAFSSSKDERAP